MTAPFDEARDATWRTRLANERTYLAWWRTGLTSLAVCIGLGRIVPGVSHVTTWPYQVVGAGYGVLGLAFVAAGHLRLRGVESALRRGEFVHPHDRLLTVILAGGLALGAATVMLILVDT